MKKYLILEFEGTPRDIKNIDVEDLKADLADRICDQMNASGHRYHENFGYDIKIQDSRFDEQDKRTIAESILKGFEKQFFYNWYTGDFEAYLASDEPRKTKEEIIQNIGALTLYSLDL